MADLEIVRQKVQSILVDKGITVELHKDHFRLPHDSTTVVVRIDPWGDSAVVRVIGLVSQYVPISEELKSWVCDQSAAWLFGHVAYTEIEGKAFLEFRHNLLGDFLDPDELISVIAVVATSANELDDIVKERFGGERWIDPHQ